MAKIRYLIGGPEIIQASSYFAEAVGYGAVSASTTEIVVDAAEFNLKLVFHGDFDVAGGLVTGGTMTGFDLLGGSNRLIKASGYATDGAALAEAIEDFQSGTDFDALVDLIYNVPLKVVGSDRNDYALNGGAADDVLVARAGHDFLWGGELGRDILKGGRGKDFVEGGTGADTLWGGPGDDAFFFGQLSPLSPPTTFDRIRDFTPGEDLFSLFFVMEHPPAPGLLGDEYFHAGKHAETPEQIVLYQRKTGKVMLDFDGSGPGAAYALAKVDPGTRLGAEDFHTGFQAPFV
jgi:hypothetical protein